MALFADGLDHIEWKSGIRCDGTAMSIYNIIAVSTVGVATSVFNAMLSGAGYVAPEIIDGVTVAATQSAAVKSMITFAFVGLETITGIILAVLLLFLNVEKTIVRKQAKIREYQQADAEARGEEWVAPEIRAAQDEEKYLIENEEAFAAALKEKCAKKGLNFDDELSTHKQALSDKQRKAEEKKRIAEKKAAEKAKRAEERKAAKIAALSPEKRAALEQKAKLRAEKEEREWREELKKGEAYRAKIQAELAAKQE